jgi:hypothetical protein
MALEDDFAAAIDAAARQKPERPQQLESFQSYLKRRGISEDLLPHEYNRVVDDYSNAYADVFVKQSIGQRPKKGVAQYDENSAAARDKWQSAVTEALPKRNGDGFLDTTKNYVAAFAGGVVGAVKSASDVFGDENAISETLGTAQDYLQGQQSTSSKIEGQRQQQSRKYAENSGSFFHEVATGIRTIRGQDVASGVGSLVPNLLLGGGLGFAGRGMAAAGMAATGAAQGVGELKGDIADRVKNDALQKGFSKADAEAMGRAANDYENIPVAALGAAAGLGLVGGLTGAERAVIGGKSVVLGANRGLLKRTGIQGAEEGLQEGSQGALSRLEQNRASMALGLTNDQLTTGLAGTFFSDGVLGFGLGAGSGLKGNKSISITDIQNADPVMQNFAPARKKQIGKMVMDSDIEALAANDSATGDMAMARNIAIKILESKNAAKSNNAAGDSTPANDTSIEPDTDGVADTFDDATKKLLEQSERFAEETESGAATGKPAGSADQEQPATPILGGDGGIDAQPNITEQVAQSGDDNIEPNQRSQSGTDATVGDNAAAAADGEVQSYGQVAVFRPNETGNKPKTEAINRAIAEIEAEGFPVNAQSAQIWAENHYDSYLDYIKATGAKESAGRQNFIDGTVDNMLATMRLNGKPLAATDAKKADARLGYLNTSELGWEGMSRADAGDRIGRDEVSYRRDLAKNEEQIRQRNAPAVQAGDFVRYGSAVGYVVSRPDGLYVVDAKSDNDAFIEGGESGVSAHSLGVIKLSPPKALAPQSRQPAAVPTQQPARQAAALQPTSNAEAVAAGQSMTAHTAALRNGSDQEIKDGQGFSDALELLTLQYGDEVTGYVLDQIERKLGEYANRETIIKEIEDAINDNYQPFQDSSGNGAGNQDNAKRATTENRSAQPPTPGKEVSANKLGDTQALTSPDQRQDFAPTSPEVRAEQKRQQAIRSAKSARLRAITFNKSPFLAFLGEHRVKLELKPDFSPDKNPLLPGYGPLFRRSGLQLDELATRAAEDGFLPPNTEDVTELSGLIERQIRGEKILPLYTDDGAEIEMQRRMQEAQADYQNEQDEIAKAQELTDQALDDLIADFQAAMLDYPQGPAQSDVDMETAMLAAGFTEEEITNAITDRSTSQAGQGESTGNAADATARAGTQGADGREGATGSDQTSQARQNTDSTAEVLTAPTRQEVLDQQQRKEKADKAEARAKAAADKKEKLDREAAEIKNAGANAADRFVLGGNTEDELSGQGGMFDAPKQESQADSTAASAPTNPSNATAIKKAINAIFGNTPGAWDAISKNTVVVETAADVPADVVKSDALTDNAQAFYQPLTGKIYLIADRIERGNEAAVWLHEVFHKRGVELLGQENIDKLQRVVEQWNGRKAGTVERAIYDAANARAAESGNYNAEFLAYAIEEAVSRGVTPDGSKGNIKADGWFAKVKSLFETALAKLLGKPASVSANDLVAMAYGAAKLEALDSTGAMDGSKTGTPAFKKWFGDSKVVDAEGRPLVVYHGTVGDFSAFSKARLGKTTGAVSAKSAFFFTDHPRTASDYSGVGAGRELRALMATAEKAEAKAQRTGKTADRDAHARAVDVYETQAGQDLQFNSDTGVNSGANVMPAYLTLTNPLVHDFKGEEYREQTYAALIEQAKGDGRDGVIFQNTIDPGNPSHQDAVTVYGVFEPTQIKSATGNNGNYDPASTDIRFSERPSLAATQSIAKTGKLPKEKTSRTEIQDTLITKLTDSTRPFDVWTRDLPDQGAVARMISAKNRASGMEADFNKRVMTNYGKRISAALGAIVKAGKANKKPVEFDAAQRLAGDWMSATYAPIANQNLLAKDKAALQEALTLVQNDDTPANRSAVTRAKNVLIKRQAAIIDPRVIDPVQNKLEIGLAGGYNNATAKQVIADIEARIDRPLLEAAAKIVYEMNAFSLQESIRLGKVMAAIASTFDASGKYVPLTGDPRADDSAGDVFGTGSTNQSKDRAMQGCSTSLSQNGIDASFEQIQKTARYHGWSDFKDELHGLYEAEISKYLGNGDTQQQAQRKVSEDLGISRAPETMQRPSDDVIIYRKNGKSWVYDLGNKAAIDALRSAQVEPIPSALKYLGLATRTMSRMVTQFMLGFGPVNALRDTWEKSENIRTRLLVEYPNLDMDKVARAMLKNGGSALGKMVKVITPVVAEGTPLEARFKLDKNNADQAMMIEFLQAGGGSTWGDFLSTDGKALAEKLASQHSPSTKAMEVLEVWNNSWELVSSFAAFKALRENGVDAKTAADMGLELMNFRKSGTIMKPIKAVYMFAQPIATGGHQLLKTLATPRGKKRFTAYMLAGMALYALLRSGEDDDELGINHMDETSVFQLERNIVIKYGSEGKSVNIPIGFGLPMLAWGYAVNLDKMLLGKQTAAETAAEIAKLYLKTFAPVAPSEASISQQPMVWLTQSATPSALKPLVNVALDRTAFGQAMTNSRFEKADTAKALQGRKNTPEFYKDVAKEMASFGLDMYPETAKELIKGYAIGPLNEIFKAWVDNPAKEARGKEQPSVFVDRIIKMQNREDLVSRLYYRHREELNSVGVKASLGKELSGREQAMLKLLEETKKKEGSIRGATGAATRSFGQTKNQAALDAAKQRSNDVMDALQKSVITRMNIIQSAQ